MKRFARIDKITSKLKEINNTLDDRETKIEQIKLKL